MAPALVAIATAPFRILPFRPFRGRARRPRPIRASVDTDGVAGGERKVGALERRVGDLRALVASVPPAVVSIRKNIGPNFVAGFCLGIAVLAAAARQVIVRSREHVNRGSVADLVRRGQLKSGQRGIAKLRTYDDPFSNPLVKIDEGTSTAKMFGKEYRLAPVRLTKEQQAMHQKRRSHAYQWKRPTVFLREGDSLPPDVDPDTVRWIPANHPFTAASSEVDEETAKQNVYQKDGVPSRVKAEYEAFQTRLEASNDVTKFPSDPRSTQSNEKPLRSSGEPSGSLQRSEFDSLENQNGQPIIDSGKHSSDDSSLSKRLERQ
ncbi:protein MULTIPLE CHLOROPLAST DIVISION SITE 1-like [Phragmites australis]|uniref:protein MULTIPLE CHLOROPLAST DIVISION SITE 1-like n=1 Tax=Phragmites australis TaxID=29695 RepID=UPI002D797E87|nr:protein MULTIPLE CHLOROPLAST DIVISION SITE 1-like [Phragmites australis]